jgi:serine/alanine adding enzyme
MRKNRYGTPNRANNLGALENVRFRGVLPLFSIRSLVLGNSLVSIPFSSYGGVLADTEEAREALLSRAVELGRELGSSQIELRQGDECSMSWSRASHKVTMEVHLPASVDDYWKQLSSGRRKKIRYSLRHQFRAEWGGIEAVPGFYHIFAVNMRNLGTPVYPHEFFENQLRRLPLNSRILTLWDGAKAVAAAFLTAHLNTLEVPWSGSLSESRKKHAPMALNWTIIQKAIEQEFRRVDLGRSSLGSGSYQFKRHWNPLERPLYWYYWLAPGTSMRTLSADNPKFRLATQIWKRLPVAVANGLGPRLARSIP